MMMFSEITEKVCVKESYLTRKRKFHQYILCDNLETVWYVLVLLTNRKCKWQIVQHCAAISATAADKLLLIFRLVQ